MDSEPWPVEWLRGALELCVLAIISRGSTYGYAIAQDLQAVGLGTVKGGTLYPLLSRFEQAGLVDIDWRQGDSGPGRKYYQLSDKGREHFDAHAARWLAFTDLATGVISAQRSHDE